MVDNGVVLFRGAELNALAKTHFEGLKGEFKAALKRLESHEFSGDITELKNKADGHSKLGEKLSGTEAELAADRTSLLKDVEDASSGNEVNALQQKADKLGADFNEHSAERGNYNTEAQKLNTAIESANITTDKAVFS